MALIVRDPWSGKPLRAIEVTKTPAQLKPLFYCDLKHALLHSTFRRIVLRNALGVKLDGRTFSSLLRELDPSVLRRLFCGARVRAMRDGRRAAATARTPREGRRVAAAPGRETGSRRGRGDGSRRRRVRVPKTGDPSGTRRGDGSAAAAPPRARPRSRGAAAIPFQRRPPADAAPRPRRRRRDPARARGAAASLTSKRQLATPRRLTGYISYSAFDRLLRKDAMHALNLGLRFVSAEQSARMGTRPRSHAALKTNNEPSPPTMGQSASASSLGVGVTQRRLRRELTRCLSEKALAEEAAPARGRRQQAAAPKKRRELLRHELTELKGAGILLTEPTRLVPPTTESHDAWRHPRERTPAY